MAEPGPLRSEGDLEGELRALGSEVVFPPTPDLAVSVRRRLAAPPRRAAWSARRLLALAALAAALLLGALTLSRPGPRAALAGHIGPAGVVIEHLPFVPTATPIPTPAPSATPAPTPLPVAVRLRLGERVDLAEAERRAGFAAALPAALGQPDEVAVGGPNGRGISLVYRPRPGLPATTEPDVGALLTEFPGAIEPFGFRKGAGPDTTIEDVTVAGGRGFWLAGHPHLVCYQGAGGVSCDDVRLAGNTLLWERGPVTLRLEADLSKDAALALAASVH